MSRELLVSDQTGLKRSTKQSDCYALGMVIYEVLSGQAPPAPLGRYVVLRKVMDGEHPQRLGEQRGCGSQTICGECSIGVGQLDRRAGPAAQLSWSAWSGFQGILKYPLWG